MRFVGIDIASEKHVVAVVDEAGGVLVKPVGFGEDAGEYAKLFELLGCAAEATVTARFLRAGRRRVLLGASCTLGCVSPARFGSLGDVDLLVTGRVAPPARVAALRALGLEISCA
jgi:hypothetical protein